MRIPIFFTAIVLTLLFSNQTFAQKIKTKKGITYIDNVPYLKISGASGIENQHAKFVCYKTNKLFLIFTYRTYTVDSKTHWYGEVKFADIDMPFNTSNQYIKPLIKSLYENKILTEDGTFKKEDLENYIRLYGFTPPQD